MVKATELDLESRSRSNSVSSPVVTSSVVSPVAIYPVASLVVTRPVVSLVLSRPSDVWYSEDTQEVHGSLGGLPLVTSPVG